MRLTIIPDNTPTVDSEYHRQFLKADIMDYLDTFSVTGFDTETKFTEIPIPTKGNMNTEDLEAYGIERASQLGVST